MVEPIDEPKEPRSAALAAPEALPCLDSNNSTEDHQSLQSNHRKTAAVLGMSVGKMVDTYGLEHVGFLTLTFADHVTCAKEAQRRLNSLMTHVVRKRYRDYVCVLERQKSGRIHYHLLVVLEGDIRTGVNFEEFGKGDYRSAAPALRSEWAFWRSTARKFRFGRTELLPLRSNKEAISEYVGKYIAKHIGQRKEEDKGVRLVRFSKGIRVGTTNFAWNSVRGWLWRAKVSEWAAKHGCRTMEDVAAIFEPTWAYTHRDEILATKLGYYPTGLHARADGHDVPEDCIDVRVSRQSNMSASRTEPSPTRAFGPSGHRNQDPTWCRPQTMETLDGNSPGRTIEGTAVIETSGEESGGGGARPARMGAKREYALIPDRLTFERRLALRSGKAGKRQNLSLPFPQ